MCFSSQHLEILFCTLPTPTRTQSDDRGQPAKSQHCTGRLHPKVLPCALRYIFRNVARGFQRGSGGNACLGVPLSAPPFGRLGVRDHTGGPGGSLHTFSPERKYDRLYILQICSIVPGDCTPRVIPRAARSGRHGPYSPRNDTENRKRSVALAMTQNRFRFRKRIGFILTCAKWPCQGSGKIVACFVRTCMLYCVYQLLWRCFPWNFM